MPESKGQEKEDCVEIFFSPFRDQGWWDYWDNIETETYAIICRNKLPANLHISGYNPNC